MELPVWCAPRVYPPGQPVDNGYVESFNGRLRDEFLNVETFFDLSDVREKLERWRQDYNQVRPHSALGDLAPEEFTRAWKESSASSLRAAGPANHAPAGAVHSMMPRIQSRTAFRPAPSATVKGGSEKLSKDSAEDAVGDGNLLEVVN